MRLAHRGEALAACLLLPAALELVPATTLFGWLRRIPARRGRAARPEELASLVDRTLVKLPGLWRHTCLRRALVLTALLRRDSRDAEVVIYCASGNRSAFAAESMQRMGYTNVCSLAGGIRGWAESGGEIDG